MQDSSRPVNPLLKPAPPEGANVVDSSTAGAERTPILPQQVPPPIVRRRRVPSDVTGFFIVATAVLLGYATMARVKPEHCVNDGSRWDAVFYLVEYGTYEFLPDWGEIKGVAKRGVERPEQHAEKYDPKASPEEKARITGLMRQFGERYYRHVWDIPPFSTVDMICVADAQNREHFYSSKPPLLSTCVAGVVIGLEKIVSPMARMGWIPNWLNGNGVTAATRPTATQSTAAPVEDRFRFREHPLFYMRAAVVLVQLIPFLIMLWVIRQRVVEQTDSPFVQNFCVGSAALATYLTSYAVPLNNHLVAAYCALFAVHAGMRVWTDGRREWHWFVLAGLFGGMCHALELPATLLTVGLLAALIYKAPRRALLLTLPAMLIPIAASVYTTWLVTGSVMPIPSRINERRAGERPQPTFYDYDGSYWYKNKYTDGPSGIDASNETKQVYLANLLLGHHGYFILTPLFILSLAGIGRHLSSTRRRWAALATLLILALVAAVGVLANLQTDNSSLSWPGPVANPSLLAKADHAWECVKAAVSHPGEAIHQLAEGLWGIGFLMLMGAMIIVNLGMYTGEPEQRHPWLAASTLVLFLVVLLFYTFATNNYAGVSQGPRWLFWMIPLWLLMLPAGIGLFASWRLGRLLCYLCLLVSLVSVGWGFPRPQEDVRATDRPFTHSWLHAMGWSKW